APAEPTSWSVQQPAPSTGESPQRPGSFHARPLVVVTPDISPLSFTAEQLMVPVGGNSTRLIAARRNSGSMPRSAAMLSSFFNRCGQSAELVAAAPIGPGGRQFGLSSPGPHQSWLELVSFHSSHTLRECSVSRFSFGSPIAYPKRSAPSPTSITWPVCRRTMLASCETFLMLRTPPTLPAVRVGPCIRQESSSTTPSSLGSPPRPTLSSLGSSSGPLTTASAASSVSPPLRRMS